MDDIQIVERHITPKDEIVPLRWGESAEQQDRGTAEQQRARDGSAQVEFPVRRSKHVHICMGQCLPYGRRDRRPMDVLLTVCDKRKAGRFEEFCNQGIDLHFIGVIFDENASGRRGGGCRCDPRLASQTRCNVVDEFWFFDEFSGTQSYASRKVRDDVEGIARAVHDR